MSMHLQPPVPLVTLVKTDPPIVIKNEPPEESLEEEICTDIKNIDIVYHPLPEDLIKSETVLEDILENKLLESVQTQAFVVKTENSPFIKTENITQRNNFEDISDGNVSRGTGQGVVEVQASNEHSNASSNLQTDEQFVLNFSKDLNSISVRSRKYKSTKKTDFAECYKTDDTTLWEKQKIKVIKASVIPVEAHEYTSLAKGKHVCNHCQHACNKLNNLKRHIEKIHRDVTTMYQCPYCPYKSKWSLRNHIIQNHKDTKDIQWFQCNLCEKKFKLKSPLTRHMKVHLRHKQMKDGLDLREKSQLQTPHLKLQQHIKSNVTFTLSYLQSFEDITQKIKHDCDKCNYKTCRLDSLKKHKLVHLKPEEIQYFYCYHCSHKSKQKPHLKRHIIRLHLKNVKQVKRYGCNKCNYRTDESSQLKNHKLTHLKPEEIQYFYCYHCSYKAKWKSDLKKHIFLHFKKEQVKFDCYICNFMTPRRESIIKHIKKHSKV